MICVVIYVDILIIINLIVNYFLLKASEKILKKKVKFLRILLSAFIGAISSLYIFLPINNLFFDLTYKMFLCLIMTAVAFGVPNIKGFIKSAFMLFFVTFLFAGVMMAIWQIFKPYGMYAEKFVVYFNVSPLVLVFLTVTFYLCLSICVKLFGKIAPYSRRCRVDVFYDDKSISLNALIDTGNSLSDVFGTCEIIIVDKGYVEKFLIGIEEMNNRFRVIPFKSVSGEDLLDGYRMDRAKVFNNNKSIELKSPIIALSKTKIEDDFNAIINPQIFD